MLRCYLDNRKLDGSETEVSLLLLWGGKLPNANKTSSNAILIDGNAILSFVCDTKSHSNDNKTQDNAILKEVPTLIKELLLDSIAKSD